MDALNFTHAPQLALAQPKGPKLGAHWYQAPTLPKTGHMLSAMKNYFYPFLVLLLPTFFLSACFEKTESESCQGENPATTAPECLSDDDCNGSSCVDSGECQPFFCQCNARGEWDCSSDCNPIHHCEEKQNGPSCDSPNPAEAQDNCESDGDCDGASCVDLCKPSSCECEELGWVCTKDCGPLKRCAEEDDGPLSCEGEDPSLDACTKDSDCGEDEECLEDPENTCRPPSCLCDESGEWACDDGCMPSHQCVPKPVCLETPPNLDACDSDEACGEGKICVLDHARTCRPSECTCQADGSWSCTRDCQDYHQCVDDNTPALCSGTKPSLDGCKNHAQCDNGEFCLETRPGECRPSSCVCDAFSGQWACSDDCEAFHECQEVSCNSRDRSQDGCTHDLDCEASEVCAEYPEGGCRPSGCTCTPEGWLCTADCLRYHRCVPADSPNLCGEDPPSKDGCQSNSDCLEGEACTLNEDACRPSSCTCDPDSQAWECSDDCEDLHECRSILF